MSDDFTPEEELLCNALQGDREAIREVAARLSGRPAATAEAQQQAMQQFDAAVKHRAQGVAEFNRFQDHFPDVVADEQMYAAALKLDKAMYERHPNMTERDRFSAVGEAIRRGFGDDTDHAEAIAAEQRHRRRAQEEAGTDEYAHKPTAADVAIAESEAEYESFKSEGIAQIVRGRGPTVLPPRTDEQKLRDERIALERRRRAAGW